MRKLTSVLAAAALSLGAVPLSAHPDSGPAFTLASVEADAARGDAEAIATLGWMYETGTGVDENAGKAASLYQTAVTKGDAFGQWRLGVMIDEGKTAGSDTQAVALFREAVAGKSAGATASLGVMYATGRGVERDYEAAMRYYQAAARMGSAHGLEGIGVLYANGQGVARDMEEALAHWLAAASAGDEDAASLLMRFMPESGTPEAAVIFNRAMAIADDYGIGAAKGGQ